MEIPTFREASPVESRFTRIPIAGPKPWNTLAFIQCRGLGRQYLGNSLFRYRMSFSSNFEIGDFKQKDLDWYQKHTYISAALFVNRLYTNTELNFIVAAEDVKGFVDAGGRIGFETQIAMFHAGSDVFEADGSLSFAYSVSAYVLLYEPEDNPPPSVPSTKPGWMPKIEVLPPQFGRRRDFMITDEPSIRRKPPDE